MLTCIKKQVPSFIIAGGRVCLFTAFFVPLPTIMIVENMNLHEIYANLMGDMTKLNWKRDTLFRKAFNEIKKSTEFPAFIMYNYKVPSSNNQYIIYFFMEHPMGPVIADILFIVFDDNQRFIVKWTDKGIPEVHILTSHFLQRYKERFLKLPELTANEVAVRYFARNSIMRPMNINERINKHIKKHGEFAGEGFLVQDGFSFKLSGEESIEGEKQPVRISLYTTFMPRSEMTENQREAIFEECMKDLDRL